MGRIKTALIKRMGRKLHNLHEDNFSESFEENKSKVSELAEIRSKKMRNVITGYVTRLVMNKKQETI
ncbi:MAG: 30S ribosomal protein S17e [Candidatus Woesearchaeota archaeon]